MRCPIILLFTLLSVEVFAQETYRWYPSKTRFPEGECVRMHAPSEGEAYVEKVKPEGCRPDKVTYLWAQNACFMVDAETQGKGFGLKVPDATLCAPSGSLYAFDPKKRECWIVDPDGGMKFRAKLDLKHCRPAEEDIVKKFVPSTLPSGGECVETHKTEGSARWEKKVTTSECRPKETAFVWRSVRELVGECWEIASSGAEQYREKVTTLKCRPSNAVYRFERMTEKQGDCFEVDPETMGQRYALKVAASFCRIKQ